MSVWSAEQDLKRAPSTLEDARKKQAAEEKKAADAEKAAARKEQSASRTSSGSSSRSHLRDAQRKREDASKARSRAANYSSKVATAQAAVHKAQEKLAKAQADERKKRETEERRQREKAERVAKQAERERERMERARRNADAARNWRLDDIGAALTGLGANVADTRALIASRPWENAPERIKVLFLTGEPDGVDRLRLDREIREIQEQVRKSGHRDAIVFEYRLGARLPDMIQHLNEVEPDVIHFSGHGADSGIALHDVDDQLRLMTNEELDRLLGVAPRPLTLVVFNSCNSAEQANVAARHAAASIGMQQSIEDGVARVFAGQLYNGLGFGRSLSLALRQAELYVEMKLNRTSGEPTLVLGDGVDADELIVVAPPRRNAA
jgi:hypothetical protein